jgi:uncharacterized glyoxalase superfamily protein PhnB/uncharacterized protein YndB with AHSA1/START domain
MATIVRRSSEEDMRECSVSSHLPLHPERVYDAWTVGWELWFAAPGSVHTTPRVGAPFCFDVLEPSSERASGARHPHYGRYLELVPYSRVRCTWVTGPAGTAGIETVLTIALRPHAEGGTHCELTHEGFASAEAAARHAEGWTAVLAAQGKALAHVSDDAWRRVREQHGVLPPNRSLPDAAFIPTRSYPDMDAAVVWLEQVLGCRERLRVPGHRVQLTMGNGAMVVAAWDPATAPANSGRPPATLLVRVADTDAAWARALANGAEGISAPTTYPYGERQATVRDPAGHAWTLSQTVADVDPREWGGIHG